MRTAAVLQAGTQIGWRQEGEYAAALALIEQLCGRKRQQIGTGSLIRNTMGALMRLDRIQRIRRFQRVVHQGELPDVQLRFEPGRMLDQVVSCTNLCALPLDVLMQIIDCSQENAQLMQDEVRRVVLI
jgi:hypothetical protein